MVSVREVMTPDPARLPGSATVREAAVAMRETDVGDVLVVDDGNGVRGIVTDRDIVTRVVAVGLNPDEALLADVLSGDLVTVAADDDVEEVVRRMRAAAVRRVPVLDGGQPVGIVSIGDLAIERDPDSALADISAAPPNE